MKIYLLTNTNQQRHLSVTNLCNTSYHDIFLNPSLPNRFLASLIVVLGEFDLSDDYEPKKTVQRNVKRVVVHRGYVAKTFDNDLALLEMERPVTFDEHIVPICMPQGDENFTGMIGFVTGWGRLSYGEFGGRRGGLGGLEGLG